MQSFKKAEPLNNYKELDILSGSFHLKLFYYLYNYIIIKKALKLLNTI